MRCNVAYELVETKPNWFRTDSSILQIATETINAQEVNDYCVGTPTEKRFDVSIMWLRKQIYYTNDTYYTILLIHAWVGFSLETTIILFSIN